jgi:hypothetical protein
MKIFASLLILVFLSACGRSNTIYSDGDGAAGTDGRSVLPNGFYDQSVNHALVTVDGGRLHFQLLGGTSAAGSFVDSTLTGNRALLGIGSYDGTPLADLDVSADFDAGSQSSTLRVSALVDLECDGTSPVRTIESSVSSSSASVDATSSWTIDGSDLTDAHGHVLLSASAGSSLADLLLEYPNACLRNDRSDASDAPASGLSSTSVPLAGVLLSIGSGTSTSLEDVAVTSLSINGDIYDTWGTR